MKKRVLITLGSIALLSAVVFTGCKDDEDPGPDFDVQFENAEASVAENAGSATIKIQLPGGAEGSDVEVSFTISGTAVSGTDFTISATSPITLTAGELEKTVTVTLMDNLEEDGEKTVILTITGVAINGINVPQGTLGQEYTLTITDDECSPYIADEWTYSAAYWSYFEDQIIYTANNGQGLQAGDDSLYTGTVIISDSTNSRSYKITDLVIGQYSGLGIASPGEILDDCGSVTTDEGGTATVFGVYPVIVEATISEDGNSIHYTWMVYTDIASKGKVGGGEATLTRSP